MGQLILGFKDWYQKSNPDFVENASKRQFVDNTDLIKDKFCTNKIFSSRMNAKPRFGDTR